MSPRRASERGAALVEFALILPIVVSLLMGLVTGGLAYNKKIAITDSVRGAARYGATLADSSTFATSVRDRLVQLSATELSASDVCVQLIRGGSTEVVVRSWYASSSNSSCPSTFGTAPATPTVSDGYCVVKVWGMKEATLQAVFFNSDLRLKAGSVAAYERGNPSQPGWPAGTC
jgi:Flp pilus assembly protein TadG